MSIEPQKIFEFIQCAHRHGVLDAFMDIKGRALEEAMEATGSSMEDLLSRMDDAGEETVRKLDMLLHKTGPFLRYASSDMLMGIVSRLLGTAFVRQWMIGFIKRSILKMTAGNAVRPARDEGMRNG